MVCADCGNDRFEILPFAGGHTAATRGLLEVRCDVCTARVLDFEIQAGEEGQELPHIRGLAYRFPLPVRTSAA